MRSAADVNISRTCCETVNCTDQVLCVRAVGAKAVYYLWSFHFIADSSRLEIEVPKDISVRLDLIGAI